MTIGRAIDSVGNSCLTDKYQQTEVGNGMATILRFNEGLTDFTEIDVDKARVVYINEMAVIINLDGEDVGFILADGAIIITPNSVTEISALSIRFTETQWTAIALRAKEFRERCARIAQEEAQEQQDRMLDKAYEEMEALGASSPA